MQSKKGGESCEQNREHLFADCARCFFMRKIKGRKIGRWVFGQDLRFTLLFGPYVSLGVPCTVSDNMANNMSRNMRLSHD
jgi:hypothetical protein